MSHYKIQEKPRIFENGSGYEIYNPITQEEWDKFWSLVKINHLAPEVQLKLQNEIYGCIDNLLVRKSIRRQIAQNNTVYLTNEPQDINYFKKNRTSGGYTSQVANKIVLDFQRDNVSFSFLHELLHDQQFHDNFFIESSSEEDAYIASKLCEAEAAAYSDEVEPGCFVYYSIAKEQAIENLKKSISLEQFKSLNLVASDVDINQAYETYINAEAIKLAIGKYIAVSMQPYNEEMLITAERLGTPLQAKIIFAPSKGGISIGKPNDSAIQLRNWQFSYNQQAYNRNAVSTYTQRRVDSYMDVQGVKNYFEEQYPVLKTENYWQRGLNHDDMRNYGYDNNSYPELKIGTEEIKELGLTISVMPKENGYTKIVQKNGQKVYECEYNTQKQRHGKEIFYMVDENGFEMYSATIWKNGQCNDNNVMRVEDINNNEEEFKVQDVTKNYSLPDNLSLYNKDGCCYLVDKNTGMMKVYLSDDIQRLASENFVTAVEELSNIAKTTYKTERQLETTSAEIMQQGSQRYAANLLKSFGYNPSELLAVQNAGRNNENLYSVQNGMFYQSVIKNNHDANKVREIYLDKRYADGENSSEQPNNVKIVYYGDGKTPSLVNIKVPITNEKNEETGHKEIIASFYPNGQLEEYKENKNGMCESFIHFYENGTKMLLYTTTGGVLRYNYDCDGSTETRLCPYAYASFAHEYDLRTNALKSKTVFDEQNKIGIREEYAPDGKTLVARGFVNGGNMSAKKCGKWVVYTTNENIELEYNQLGSLMTPLTPDQELNILLDKSIHIRQHQENLERINQQEKEMLEKYRISSETTQEGQNSLQHSLAQSQEQRISINENDVRQNMSNTNIGR